MPATQTADASILYGDILDYQTADVIRTSEMSDPEKNRMNSCSSARACYGLATPTAAACAARGSSGPI